MKHLRLLLALSLVYACNSELLDREPEIEACDGGTFVGEVRLTSQAEVNAFGANCYTKIDGLLHISNPGEAPSDIHDLKPLSSLTEVFSTSDITPKIYVVDNDSLTTLEGLQNIRKASGIWVTRCDRLTDLNGLRGLRELYGEGVFNDLIITKNDSLVSLEGLEGVSVVGSLDNDASTFLAIQENQSLQNLDPLSNLEAVHGHIYIGGESSSSSYGGNDSLTDLCGLSNLFNSNTYDIVIIENNAYNPTVQDMLNGNCSQ